MTQANKANKANPNPNGMQPIAAQLSLINQFLAPGVTASINLRGELRYSVRVTKSGIAGNVIKTSLGTFSDYGTAIRTMIEYKLKGYIDVFPHDKVNDLLLTFAADCAEKQQTGIQALAQLSGQLQDVPTTAKGAAAQTLINNAISKELQTVQETHSDAFQVLNRTDFSQIQADHPFNYTADNGESRTIPASVVNAWFKSLTE